MGKLHTGLLLFLWGTVFALAEPKASHAELDLGHWDFGRDASVELNGEWQFAWKNLDTQRQVPPHYEYVPGSWNHLQWDGASLGPNGFASYRLVVHLPPTSQPLSLELEPEATSSRLYVNGRMVGEQGNVAETEESSEPHYGITVYDIAPGTRTLDLVVQISNFQQHHGGFWKPLHLGTTKQIHQGIALSRALRFFLSGCLILMALYHFILFFYRRRDRIHLIFTTIAFAAITRILIPSDHLIQLLVPKLDFSQIIRIEYLSLLLILTMIVAYAHEFFARFVPAYFVKVMLWTTLCYAVFAMFAPISWLTLTQGFTQFVNLTAGVLVISCMLRAWRRRAHGAKFLSIALILLFLTLVNDILHSRQIINTGYFASFALFVFVFVQWILIAERYTQSFRLMNLQREQFLQTMADAIESKDKYTGGHVERVAEFSRDLAKSIGYSDEESRALHLSAMVHDVGKIGIRDSLLNKPGRFTDEEMLEMQLHPGIGFQLLSHLSGDSLAAEIALHHQQRYNGSGYTGLNQFPPLEGEQIPLAARIVAVADYWDAISSDRPYRKAMPISRCVKILVEECGIGLDPDLVKSFLLEGIWLRYLQNPVGSEDLVAVQEAIRDQWGDLCG